MSENNNQALLANHAHNSKLDLIFEKEPPEVQRKLMNLLIQYNAVMHYNHNEDKFEVDLLLPFKNQGQREQFINNFMSRRIHNSQNNHEEQIQSKKEEVNLSRNQQFDSYQTKNHAEANNNSIRYKQRKLSANLSQTSSNRVRKYSEKSSSQNRGERDDSLSLNFTNTVESNSKKGISEHSDQINFEYISGIIKDKISAAIHQIRFKKSDSYLSGKKINKQSEDMILPKGLDSSGYQEPSFKQSDSNDIQKNNQKVSIIGSESSHNDESIVHRKNLSLNSQIRIEQAIIGNQNTNQIYESESDHKINDSSYIAGNSSSNYEYPHVIEQGKEEDQEDINIQNNSDKNSTKIKGKTQQKYKNSHGVMAGIRTDKKKKPSSKIRQKYNEFLKRNHKDMNKLYEDIKKDMHKNRAKMVEKSRRDPILVLEEDISQAGSEEDQAFKEQIMKQYQQNILVHNDNMSSEDLVRYFRYLMHHARSLYIKSLSKPR